MTTPQVVGEAGQPRRAYQLRVSSTARAALEAEWARRRWIWNECVARSKKAQAQATAETCGPALNSTRCGFRLTDGRPHLAGGIVRPVVWSRDLPADPSWVRATGRQHGLDVRLVHPAHTTMDCASCAARTKHALPLSERTYTCTACGVVSPGTRTPQA